MEEVEEVEDPSCREEREALWEDANSVLSIFTHRMIRSLGGLWIKTGQYLSARADVMPPAYVEELSQLQDAAPPRSYASVIETCGGASAVDALFETFDRTPLATASIAQVHRATLRVGVCRDETDERGRGKGRICVIM